MALSFAALRHCVPNALQCQQTAAQQTARPRAPCRILRTVSNRSTACSSTSALHAAPYPSRPAPGSRRQNRLAATFRPAATPPAPQEKPLTLGERLSVSYLVVAFLWLVLACSQLLAFPAPITTVPVYLWRFLGCASLLCVSVAYSLSVAAAGRGSDTYKRLSLGLAHYSAFCAVALLSVPAHRALLPFWPLPPLPFPPDFCLPLGFFAALTCIASSVASYTDLLRDKPAANGFAFFSWGGRALPANASSFVYRLLTVGAFAVGVAMTLRASTFTMPLILPFQMLGTFLLSTLTAAMLVLADASERGRLGASTFKRLNLALAVSLLAAGANSAHAAATSSEPLAWSCATLMFALVGVWAAAHRFIHR